MEGHSPTHLAQLLRRDDALESLKQLRRQKAADFGGREAKLAAANIEAFELRAS